MKNNIIYSFVLLIIISSCSEKKDLETYIPNNTTNLVKINLPNIKSKLLTWDFLSYALFNETPSDENNLDLSIDIGRPAYAYSTEGFNETLILLPIDDNELFENSILSKSVSKPLFLDKFKYTSIQLYEKEVYVSWIEDIAILSLIKPNNNFFEVNDKPNFLSITENENDVNATIQDPKLKSPINFHLNFNDGNIKTIFTKGISENLSLVNPQNIINPKLNKSNLGFNGNLSRETLLKWSPKLLHKLQQYGVLFTEQLDTISPLINGNISLQFSDENVLNSTTPKSFVTFGLNKKSRFENLLNSDFQFNETSKNYTDNEEFQFITYTKNTITFSNFEQEKEMNPTSSKLNFNLEKKALYNDLFFVLRLFIGRDMIDDLPVENILFDFEQGTGELNINFEPKDKNSLQHIIDFIAIERDEI